MSTTWKQAFINTFQHLSDQLITFIPQFVIAAIVLVIGILVASLLGRVVERLINFTEHLISHLWQHQQSPRTESLLAKVARKVMFWVIVLFFFAASLQMIEWPLLNKLVGDIRGYLPKLIVGLLVIFAGFIAGNMAYNAIVQTKATFEQRFMMGRILQTSIILTTVLIGIEQIGINIELLTNLILIVVGVLLFGFVSTFSKASKASASNLLAMKQVRHLYTPGTYLTVGELQGRILEVTTTQVVLETPKGLAYIPASKLQTDVFILNGESSV